MAKIVVNGKEIIVKDGTNLVDAVEAIGMDIPHYCYHPGLSVAGQCRMCVVEIEGNPKLQIGCNIRCTDGLKVITDSPKVQEAVKANLEFHLINHPIDCPICDQAGECGLQEYYMEYGKYESAMEETKVLKPKVQDLGEHIVLDKERCILCSRCVRFTQEVSKTNEFGIFNRGDRSVIGTYDNKPLSGNYQVNTVDICPVGALTSKDFRFEQRVWFLDESESVCSGCSKGCNVFVHHKKGKHIYRLKPRYNEKINSYWMCDKGRYTYKNSNFDRRLTQAKLASVDLPQQEAIATWASELKLLTATESMNEIGVFVTPHHTDEELKSIFDTFIGQMGITKFYSEDIEAMVKNDHASDGFLLRSDIYPNSRGFLSAVKNRKVKLGSVDEMLQGIKKENLSHLIFIVPETERIIPILSAFTSEIRPNQFVAMMTPQYGASDLFSNALCIPSLSHYEKTGTLVNHEGVEQKISASFKMFRETDSIQNILSQLLLAQQSRAEKVGT